MNVTFVNNTSLVKRGIQLWTAAVPGMDPLGTKSDDALASAAATL